MTPFIDQTLHQSLTLLLSWTLLSILIFYLIARGFHKTFAMGGTCQQRTLTPRDTKSRATLELACSLMLRSTSPELVLFPEFLSLEHPSVLILLPASLGTSISLCSFRWVYTCSLYKTQVHISLGKMIYRKMVESKWKQINKPLNP